MMNILDMEQDLRSSASSMHGDQINLNNNRKIINDNPDTEKNASEQQIGSRASPQQHQGSINTIPAEIIQMIMSELQPCMRACLGVTCKKMYRNFKSVNPGIVSLFTIADLTWESKTLAVLLATWMGPRYRLGRTIPHNYLLRSVYGDGARSWKEMDLKRRYFDYWRSEDDAKILSSMALPNPCNIGDCWDQDAIAIIERDLLRHPHVNDWAYYWKNYWIWERNSLHLTHITTFWAEKLAEIVLSEGCYTDWIDMIGF
ncbi:hypothetical protein EYC80_000959 [Monilinia laxa]|uniref:F-box domain-containing protein n=1 Tax=Monilinia laxa TaxID=61186 RepID=A0A5N6K7N6_MONLA|nr:hypothetical protein EYC80_000959 [Monilinia laxa]